MTDVKTSNNKYIFVLFTGNSGPGIRLVYSQHHLTGGHRVRNVSETILGPKKFNIVDWKNNLHYKYVLFAETTINFICANIHIHSLLYFVIA
jgi:hypothetical protein